MQNLSYPLTSTRDPQPISVPGGKAGTIRMVFPLNSAPVVVIEVDPTAAIGTRVFCWRGLGEDVPGTGWSYVGGSEAGPMAVYEQASQRG